MLDVLLEIPGCGVRRVAIRLAVRHQNRERIRAVIERSTEPPAVPQPADVDLLRSMRQLPPAHRAALALFYHEDRPVAEIASILGWTVPATKVLGTDECSRSIRNAWVDSPASPPVSTGCLSTLHLTFTSRPL